MLEADLAQRAHHAEAQALMERDRGPVAAVADDRAHLTPGAFLAVLDELAQERPADAFARRMAVDIDGILDGEAIGRARPVGPGIGIADDPILPLGDDIGEGLAPEAEEAGPHVVDAGRGFLERGKPMA